MHIAGVVVSLTLSVLHTENDLLADVIVALVAIRTVGGVNTTSFTQSCVVTVGTVLRVVR